MSVNSFNSRSSLKIGNKQYEIYRLDALDKQGISTKHLPFSLRILLENLLRTEDGRNVEKKTSARWPTGTANPSPTRKLPSPPAAFSCRISPESPAWSISPPCATPCSNWAATLR